MGNAEQEEACPHAGQEQDAGAGSREGRVRRLSPHLRCGGSLPHAHLPPSWDWLSPEPGHRSHLGQWGGFRSEKVKPFRAGTGPAGLLAGGQEVQPSLGFSLHVWFPSVAPSGTPEGTFLRRTASLNGGEGHGNQRPARHGGWPESPAPRVFWDGQACRVFLLFKPLGVGRPWGDPEREGPVAGRQSVGGTSPGCGCLLPTFCVTLGLRNAYSR